VTKIQNEILRVVFIRKPTRITQSHKIKQNFSTIFLICSVFFTTIAVDDCRHSNSQYQDENTDLD
jgi:hypothetical protein